LLKGCVRERLLNPKLNAEDGLCLKQLHEWLELSFLLEHLLFTCSFTEAGNLLSQWRAYCPPSAGVSIGFDPDSLLQAADGQGFQLVQCIYDRGQQSSLVEEWIDLVLVTKDDKEEPPTKADPSQSYHAHFRSHEERFLQVAARMKHAGFSEEQEWRLISRVGRDLMDPKIKFRAGKTWLIPYVDFTPPVTETGGLSLKHIYIGPARDHNTSFRAITLFLANSGVRVKHGVRACGIPLRNW
jgi:Protein of unknown function (DUF2971)